jgi:uncharacterized protein (TIGR03032 family)
MATAIQSTGDSAPPYAFNASPGFVEWLHSENLAIAITTYQIGKLFMVGAASATHLNVTERTFQRCLGIAPFANGFFLAGRNNILRFENVVPRGQALERHDAVFVPQVSWYTGDVFAHDVGVTAAGRPVFVNTMFSCLATIDETASFRPLWRPPFISALTPGDRCHLNGLAMEDGRPRFVTAAAQTDVAGGWREQRSGGGCVIDVASGEIVATGLSMPHSPRLQDGRLYLCNAGTGELGEIELRSGRFQPIAFCPGFARGLAIHGHHALVGLSLPRQSDVFSGLPLDERLKAAQRAPECVIQVIDLHTGTMVHWLRAGGVVRELYDIACLPGFRNPMVVGFAQDQINRLITSGAPLPLDTLLAQAA